MTVALLLETVTLLTAISGPTRKECWPGKLPRLRAAVLVTPPNLPSQNTGGVLLPMGPRVWFDRAVSSPPLMNAQMAIAPVGLPSAASGIANSRPLRTVAACGASGKAAALVLQVPPSTPFVLLLLIVAWMPNGFVPPESVPLVDPVEPNW